MSMLAADSVLLLLVVLSVGYTRRTPEPGPRGTVRLFGLGASAVVVALAAVVVVWAGYLAVDPRLRWTAPGDLPVVHGLRALAVDWLPFPQPYPDGMRPVRLRGRDGRAS
ncbi:MAG: hypothetical protein QOF84_5712 [Streptomyces sp.]|jgi:hypothetical protein|nr:hypothetical protein [Streptomyces sp.]